MTVPSSLVSLKSQQFAIKANEHELLLYMDLWATVADQTPTPTRFLKNCEEVGLFNELTSPFEHDFKKATEDDVKKVNMSNYNSAVW